MKQCTLFNVPQEIAAEAILNMKDLIIKKIKADKFDEIDDLLWTLRSMQKSYEEIMEREDNA